MYYCYRHIRLDKNIPFYIGIGKKNKFSTYRSEYERAFDKYGRNKYWKNISKLGYKIEIIYETDNKQDIIEKEKEFIRLYKDSLSNMTNGGELVELTHDIKEKIRLRMIGNNLMNGRILSYEWRKNISNSLKGKKRTENQKKKLSERSLENKYSLGIKRSDKFKERLRLLKLGNPGHGKKVLCLNDEKVFNTIKSCSQFYFDGSISNCHKISRYIKLNKCLNGLNFKFV